MGDNANKNNNMSPLGMIGMGAANTGVGMGLSWLDELLFGKKRRKQQIEQQKKLTDIQEQANMRLADHGMGIQKEMFDYTGYEAQRKQMENAGLNPALMYGHAGSGGSTGQGGAGSVGMAQASDEMSRKAMDIQNRELALQERRQLAEIRNIESQTTKNLEDAGLSGAKKLTENESRELLIENLKQEGITNWLENVEKRYKHDVILDDKMNLYGNEVYGLTTSLQGMSAFSKEVVAAIVKTQAEGANQLAQELLTNKKAEYYYQELLNSIKHANADEVKANAIKLATEWSTGEMTNWKTWVDLGVDAVNMLSGVIGAGAKLKGAKAIASKAAR